MVRGQYRACLPLILTKSGEVVRCHWSLADFERYSFSTSSSGALVTQFTFFCRLTCAWNRSGRWGRTRDRSWRGSLMGRRVPDSWRDRAQGRIWFEGWLELPFPTSSRSSSRKSSSQEGTVSPSLFEEVIVTTNLPSVDINIIIRDGWRHQNGWIFRKVPRGGWGGGQMPLGTFPKIHPFWYRHPSLSPVAMSPY